MKKFEKWNDCGKTMQDYAVLYYYDQAGMKMTVAEDGGVYLGKCRVANSRPANPNKEDTYDFRKSTESI